MRKYVVANFGYFQFPKKISATQKTNEGDTLEVGGSLANLGKQYVDSRRVKGQRICHKFPDYSKILSAEFGPKRTNCVLQGC